MPKVSPAQTSFNAGEFSPLAQGRIDADRYKSGLKVCLNYIPALQGPLQRRPGTKFCAAAKDSADPCVLIPFKFSTTQNYILEFTNDAIRFFADNGQVLAATGLYHVKGNKNADSGSTSFYAIRDTNVAQAGEVNLVTSALAMNDPLEIESPYGFAELYQIKFAQSADVIYLTHPSHPPYKLIRRTSQLWSLEQIFFQDGPYQAEDVSGITLTPAAATGTTTLTTGPTVVVAGATNNGSGLIRIQATAHGKQTGDKICIAGVVGTVEANTQSYSGGGAKYWEIIKVDADNFDLVGSAFVHAYVSGGTIYPLLFQFGDVGRLIRLKQTSTWGWGQLKKDSFGIWYGHQMTINIFSTLTSTVAKTSWRLGLWSDTTGYPGACCFHQDRLGFAGTPSFPQRVDLSASAAYQNFAPSGLDGVVDNSNACAYSLTARDVNVIRWLASDERALLAGSTSNEWAIRPSTVSEALSPTNVNASASTAYGSIDLSPVQLGKATLFTQAGGRKLREMTYFFQADGFRAPDLSELSEHITKTGIIALTTQKTPIPLTWAVRADGALACMTYEREDASLRAGWSRSILGGSSDTAGNAAVVESIATIPSPDASFEQVWMSVKRYINGQTIRTIEYMTKFFDDTMEQEDAYFLDCGQTLNAPKTISGITKATPAVVTCTAHGFSNGDRVILTGVVGMTEVNGVHYKIAGVAANTFQLVDINDASNIDSTSFGTYISGGEARKMVTTISGLTWLKNETVSVLADGAVHADVVVDGSGVITLNSPAAKVSIGYKYNSDGKTLRVDAGSADGTSLGKTRRTHRAGLMVYRTLGLKIGMSFDDLVAVNNRTTGDELGHPPGLFTGIVSEIIEADYDFDNEFCFRQSDPLPGMIQAYFPQLVEQDR